MNASLSSGLPPSKQRVLVELRVRSRPGRPAWRLRRLVAAPLADAGSGRQGQWLSRCLRRGPCAQRASRSSSAAVNVSESLELPARPVVGDEVRRAYPGLRLRHTCQARACRPRRTHSWQTARMPPGWWQRTHFAFGTSATSRGNPPWVAPAPPVELSSFAEPAEPETNRIERESAGTQHDERMKDLLMKARKFLRPSRSAGTPPPANRAEPHSITPQPPIGSTPSRAAREVAGTCREVAGRGVAGMPREVAGTSLPEPHRGVE